MSHRQGDESGDDAGQGSAPRPELPPEAYRAIVRKMSIPILVVDGGGTITWAGGTVARDFGYAPHEVVGRHALEFLPPDQVDEAITSLGELAQADELGLGVPTVYAVTRPDGSLTWSAVGAVPMLDDPAVDGIVLYHLPWDAQLHFDEFLDSLLAREPLDVVLRALGRSVAASLQSIGAVVHHGFDGGRFAGASGAGVPPACIDVSEGPWHEAARTGQTLHVPATDLPGAAASAAEVAGIAGCWAIPLPPDDRHAPAVLTVWRSVHALPVKAHESTVTRSLRYVQLALVRWAEHQMLAHMATHDGLTGVANRTLFRQRLGEALAAGAHDVAVAFCDLDRFKAINDTCGHTVGDSVLAEVARRLSGALRPGDEVARIGGDEFTVLMRGITDDDVAAEAAHAFVAAMDHPTPVGAAGLRVGVSVGVARPSDGATADSMLSRADAALYRAKAAGGGRVVVADGTRTAPGS